MLKCTQTHEGMSGEEKTGPSKARETHILEFLGRASMETWITYASGLGDEALRPKGSKHIAGNGKKGHNRRRSVKKLRSSSRPCIHTAQHKNPAFVLLEQTTLLLH